MLLSSGRWYSPGWGPGMIGFLLLIRTILYGQRCGGKSGIQSDYKLVIVWRNCLFFLWKNRRLGLVDEGFLRTFMV